MSDTIWSAVLVGETTLSIWSITDEETSPPCETLPIEALGEIPGPIVAAGLDVHARGVPCKPIICTTHAAGMPQVAAIPMLRQDSPAAVTRGAETAISGYLQINPSFDGVILIVGEETCWAHISAEEVVSFQTFLTRQIARALDAPVPSQAEAFEKALNETLSRPDRLAQHLSSARAANTGQVWAHLIGAEIASAKPYWLGQRVVVLADGQDGVPYATALDLQGAMVENEELTPAYLAGFKASWDLAIDQPSN